METTTSVEEAVASQIEPLIIMCQYFGWAGAQAHLMAARQLLMAQTGAHPFNKTANDDGDIRGMIFVDKKT